MPHADYSIIGGKTYKFIERKPLHFLIYNEVFSYIIAVIVFSLKLIGIRYRFYYLFVYVLYIFKVYFYPLDIF